MANNVTFSIQTMQTTSFGSLKAVQPDPDGVYHKIPVAIFGKPSMNGAIYDTQSGIKAMTEKNSIFKVRLTSGGLEGEYGHPDYSGMTKNEIIKRTMRIENTRVSHYFTKVWGEPVGGQNTLIIYADVVPFGPYGSYLKESFADPKRNTAFSLRSLTTALGVKDGYDHRMIRQLTTFDSVDTGGFLEASKRMAPSTESLFYVKSDDILSCDIKDVISAMEQEHDVIATECLKNSELLDILETDSVSIHTSLHIGEFENHKFAIKTNDGMASPFHVLF